MRIFDPKDQLGNAILSSADTQKSSVKLEKQMSEGSTITLTSTDISDIENWELSNARVEVDGQMVSFLPETSRDTDGNLVIAFGRAFSNVVLILKRTVFDGMKHEEIAIEVKIQLLMTETMAAATAPTPRTATEVQANVAQWKALGAEAVKKEPANYPYAACSTAEEVTEAGLDTYYATTIGSDVCLISLDTVNNDSRGARTFPNVQTFEADLPSLKNSSYMFFNQKKLKTFTGILPNLTEASYMFQGCEGLTSCDFVVTNTVTDGNSMFFGCSVLESLDIVLPNVLERSSYMFYQCSKLTSWNVELPDSLKNASGMFSQSGLTSWNVELPNGITTVSSMFSSCAGLRTFSTPSGTLPDTITIASSMFYGCTSLTEWTVEMPSGLSTAGYMFSGCTSLTNFAVDLPSELSYAPDMFKGCKLNKASVQKIADSIPTVSGSQSITIGIDSTQITQAEQNAFNNTITGRGWTVTWERN